MLAVLFRVRPLELRVVIDESVLLRPMGDNSVMDTRLGRLVEVSRFRNVTWQILPLDQPHSLSLDSFVLLSFSGTVTLRYTTWSAPSTSRASCTWKARLTPTSTD
jgi:hypothetical protein